MGDQNVSALSEQTRKKFLRYLIDDINALEQMIENGQIESGFSRIGSEQELCLVGSDLRPAMTSQKILAENRDPHLTSELALWNLEINLDPQDVGPGCIQRMASQLNELLGLARKLAHRHDSELLLTGILPTIRKSELDFKNMTPSPRFRILSNILKELRGEDFSLYIEGVDEVSLKHSSILFEACNTSFQVHLQIDPREFADKYNWAQVLAGPILSVVANSPLLLGKELWAETRIALFRQSIDTRHSGTYLVDKQPRVAFGSDWLKNSAAEIFKNDVAIYNLIVAADIDEENSTGLLAKGITPQLRAMKLHNGTLYKWNRACYGVADNQAHLRIESRYIPSGPTPIDEMANAVLWIGLMLAMPDECRGNWERFFHFKEVRANFLRAAQNGLSNELIWFGQTLDASRLLADHLLPMADAGLAGAGIPADEYRPYLQVIEQRLKRRQTGASWIVESLRQLRKRNTLDESLLMITDYMREFGLSETPVHEWDIPQQSTLVSIPNRYDRVESVMITGLITVREDDLLAFAETLMHWNHFHHLPVENPDGTLAGIISARDIEGYRASHPNLDDALVSACMVAELITVSPETALDRAEKLMIVNELGSLPVLKDHQIVGIITANDIRRLRSKIKRDNAESETGTEAN